MGAQGMNHDRVTCPACGTVLDRDTVRPPCANGCRTPEGFARLGDVTLNGTPYCGRCAHAIKFGPERRLGAVR
jgi:hypothetical protein